MPPAAIPNRIRSARGHSSRPPPRIGKIITPGENHHSDKCTAATAIATVATVRPNATRRFLVMNCALTWLLSQLPATRTGRTAVRILASRAGTVMLGAGYPHFAAVACCPTLLLPNLPAPPAKKIRGQRVSQDRKTIMADLYPIRPIADSEFPAYHLVDDHAFHHGPPREPRLRLTEQLFEADRSLAAFDPALPASAGPVGIAGAYSFRMSVPGGLMPTAGVTYVAVLPTYRRRGILRSLMRRQLADIAAAGREPIAALWASEAPLYRRYGYGRATTTATFRFRRGEGAIAPFAPADPALRIRIAEPAATRAELAKVYETVLSSQPG